MGIHGLYCQNNADYRKHVSETVTLIAQEAVDIETKIDAITAAVDAGFALTGDTLVTDVALGKEFYSTDFKTKLVGTATVVINKLALDDLIVAPVKDATPDETAIAIDQYTSGAITWFADDGATPHAGAFAGGTVYVGKATITAEAGYTLRGVDANTFTHTAGTVTNTVDTGDVVITFDATGA